MPTRRALVLLIVAGQLLLLGGMIARREYWLLENKANAPSFKATRRRERNHPLEIIGKQLRRLMAWINAKEV